MRGPRVGDGVGWSAHESVAVGQWFRRTRAQARRLSGATPLRKSCGPRTARCSESRDCFTSNVHSEILLFTGFISCLTIYYSGFFFFGTIFVNCCGTNFGQGLDY